MWLCHSVTVSLTHSQCHSHYEIRQPIPLSLTLALRQQTAESRQEANSRQDTADRIKIAGRRQQTDDSRQQTTLADSRHQAAGKKQHTGSSQQVTDSRQQVIAKHFKRLKYILKDYKTF